ncbi:MAG: hypothetical protein IKQ61_00985 [Spirochaetales bacterium]|nr:hypothetical protein [Spirochaetales bacterium]MBR6061055.1 hypothetical protein [Spirochaetales bacterium]MBR6198816.1 hypothetical protein [Spirochaetales bacterium]
MHEKINKTIYFLICFGIVMLIIGIITSGIQWFISKWIFSDIPMEVKMISERKIQNLSMYIIFIGFVVPILLAFITNFAKTNCAINTGRIKRLRLAFKFYIFGSIGILLISLYRGLTFMIVLAKDISLTLDEIEASLFFGSQLFRDVCYVVSYPIFIFGLIWYLMILWDVLSRLPDSKIQK